MNKYEEKFKKVIAAKVAAYEDCENIIAGAIEYINRLQSAKDSIEDLHNTDFDNLCNLPDFILEIKETYIEKLQYKINELLNTKDSVEGKLVKLKEEVFILQSVCPHEDTTFDHKDYHKNEDYYKCNICGMIV